MGEGARSPRIPGERGEVVLREGKRREYYSLLIIPLLFLRLKTPPRPQGQRPVPESRGVSLV